MSKKSKGDSHQKPKKEVSRKRTKASLTIIKTRKKKHYDKSNYAQIEIKPCLKINQQKQKPKYYRYQQKYLKKVETEVSFLQF
ncbi:hypothetical protein M0812_17241 [Anaeramoeba flamelloides]|uniref:Uncharacterized protein n=1 Tax=Anaeramoeba flamelloides TaxID=1746091 RepID=A0AAV7ZCG4_9EUKA|nr:hypothetical protein M0812_17241 [Anaeramoeba flamelloides]